MGTNKLRLDLIKILGKFFCLSKTIQNARDKRITKVVGSNLIHIKFLNIINFFKHPILENKLILSINNYKYFHEKLQIFKKCSTAKK